MDKEERKRLEEVWKRVEEARPRLEGSAALMPRKKPRTLPRRRPPKP